MPILVVLMFLCCASGALAQTVAGPSAAVAAPAAAMPPAAPSAASAALAAPMTGTSGADNSRSDAPAISSGGAGMAGTSADAPALDASAMVDLYCLRLSYPRITGMAADAAGQWLVFADGRRVLYAAASAQGGAAPSPEEAWVVDVRTSMAEPYPLEPQRPETPLGVSPGRRRSYDLLQTLYGSTAKEVGGHLEQARLLGQRLPLARDAAQAMNRASAVLAPQTLQNPRLKRLLQVDGGFTWRRIAGENRLSPHAFGIAFDISPGIATYWRWSKLRPHPLQKSYPEAIVKAFEDQGFIWGGKWHEYDLMHFEYRPEIICKARVQQGLERLPDPEGGEAGNAPPRTTPETSPTSAP